MQTLSPAQRRTLRAKAHHLHPVVSIGQHGLTPAVLHEIDVNLSAHELIKIRVFSDARAERGAMLAQICDTLGAAAVQHLGKLLIVWRPAPKEEPPPPRRAHPADKSAARKAPQARRPRTPLPRTPARPISRGPRSRVPDEVPAAPGSRRRSPHASGGTPWERDPGERPRRRPKSVAGPKEASSPSQRRSAAKRSPKAAGRPAATPHGKSSSSFVGAAGARRRRRKAG